MPLGFNGSDPNPENIRFATIPNDLTSEKDRSGDYSPDFFEEVLRKMEAPMDRLIGRLEPPVTTIMYDSYLLFGVAIGNRRNIPAASFWTIPALVYSVFQYFDLLLVAAAWSFPGSPQSQRFREQMCAPVSTGSYRFSAKPSGYTDFLEKGEELVDYVPGVLATRVADLPTCVYGRGRDILHRGLEAVACVGKAQSLLLVSIPELESSTIAALRSTISTPIFCVGPQIPTFKLPNSAGEYSEHFRWLDSQPKGSVLYVSQGSLYSASKTQLDEMAAGLELSGVRCFWVARKEANQYRENSGEMGLMVSWCDQLGVLCHPSIGGFWSHCGWNSASEAIFAGVPMLTFPIYWDQTSNSKQIVEDWGIGWKAKENELGEESLVGREEIAKTVEKFMDSEREDVREVSRRAKEASSIFRRAFERGESCDVDFDAFINHISKV